MDTRTLLQIILGLIIASIVGVGGLILYTVTRPPAQATVATIITKDEAAAKEVNPWSKQTEAAALLVKRQRVTVPPKLDKRGKPVGEPEQVSVEALVQRPEFIKDTLKITSGKLKGWRSTWWGETKYGPSFYMVQLQFEDGHISFGPQWLVDLKGQKIVPKNVLARVITSPAAAKDDPYYDKHEQVVSALAGHRFDSGINLGGALLMYFEQREEVAEGDTVLGWTIEHDQGAMFHAFFQWVEAGEPTNAEFEFDYEKKALKPVNFQAANVMRVGEEFGRDKKRVEISPGSFNATATSDKNLWLGPARAVCQSTEQRDTCAALASILTNRQAVEALEWLLTTRSATAADFDTCKQSRNCKWLTEPKPDTPGVFQVSYLYKLDDKPERRVSWEVALKDKTITPTDRTSTTAWRATNPR